MVELPNLHEMLTAALAKAAEECGTLLGQDMEFAGTVHRAVQRDTYVGGIEDASFVIAIESQHDYQGTFYMVVSFRDAIVLSGTLLGIPLARIQEKKRLAILEADDVDAFSEIINQLIGSFNTAFKQYLPQKIHLKQSPPKKFIPHAASKDAEELVADGEYHLVQAPLQIAGHDLEKLELLIPPVLAALLDQRESCEENEADTDRKQDYPQDNVSAQEVPGEQAGTVLILDDNDMERRQFQEILVNSGVKPVTAPRNADLKMLLSQGNVQAVLVGVESSDEQELSVCRDIRTHSQGIVIPIILCARQWTRTSVLKALKNGAQDILLKPCLPDELTTKLMKMINSV